MSAPFWRLRGLRSGTPVNCRVNFHRLQSCTSTMCSSYQPRVEHAVAYETTLIMVHFG